MMEEYYNKWNLVKLMRQKRGIEHTYGWLAMAYALPALSEAEEMAVVKRTMENLLTLSDYEETELEVTE
jgi:hypothetical protein